ncbi:hypothetical protein [Variovorax sp. DXTD-1]|uniref:hypothetical protein n=1 Tax=Variovorax sp. DXTD-1 TaxID=2495592 RepID=UPI000F87CF51|nr:hypothetical protein [Variovorax sp. DXTD-1]RST47375.1 hypothetical protein EJI00_19090 [Variovorax sp. DXTD-1]
MKASPLSSPKQSPWRNPFGIALVAYYLVMVVVGLLIPADILQANAWARDFSDFMASIVPQIDRITALNIKPDVNRFYFSVLWAGSPVLFVISLFLIWDGWRQRSALMWTAPFKTASVPMVFATLVFIAMLQVNWLVDPTLRLSRSYFGTVLGRATLAQLFVLGPVIFGLGLAAWLLGWLSGYIPRNMKEPRHE